MRRGEARPSPSCFGSSSTDRGAAAARNRRPPGPGQTTATTRLTRLQDTAVKADQRRLSALVTLSRARGRRAGSTRRSLKSTARRFRFPVFSDAGGRTVGYVLHPVDLATNKASAAADRPGARAISSISSPSMKRSCPVLGGCRGRRARRFISTTPEEILWRSHGTAGSRQKN